MKYAIVYSSKTGNTKALAEHLRTALPEEDCLYFGPPDEVARKAPLLFVGFWTDKGVCDEEAAAFLQQTKCAQIALFGTAGFGEKPQYFDLILQRTAALLPVGCRVLSGFMCQGRMLQSVRDRAAAALAATPDDARAQRMIVNFDHARTHPDEMDFVRLVAWAQKMIA